MSAFRRLDRVLGGRVVSAPDFVQILARWREEKSKAESTLLNDLKEDARLATEARRQQHAAGRHHWQSAFGYQNNEVLKKQRHNAALQSLLRAHGPGPPGQTEIHDGLSHAPDDQPCKIDY